MTGCGKEMVPTESSETAVIKETIQITKKVQPPFGYDGKIYDTCSACHEAWLDVYTQ